MNRHQFLAPRNLLLAAFLAFPWTSATRLNGATGDFHGCPPEGSKSKSAKDRLQKPEEKCKQIDCDLNRLKNRDEPPDSYETLALKEILDNKPEQAQAVGKRDRSKWTPQAKAEVEKWERLGASVEGFLLAMKHEGPERCNCKSDQFKDYHLWLGAAPVQKKSELKKAKKSAQVMEISPRVLEKHAEWDPKLLSKLVRDKTKVRISGWLMWDQEHPEQSGKSRGTLWEVHPIHKIEFEKTGSFVSLNQEHP